MFEQEKEKSLFDNDDELGIQEYREDSTYIFNVNLTTVKLIRWNNDKSETFQSDFFGDTLASTATDKDNYSLININIMSRNPTYKELGEHGFTGRGEVTYDCFANWDLDIDNMDFIEFVSDFDYGVKAGDKFQVKMEDAGMYQGQFTRKQFTFTKIKEGM